MWWLLMFLFQDEELPGANGASLFVGEVSNSVTGETGSVLATGEVKA